MFFVRELLSAFYGEFLVCYELKAKFKYGDHYEANYYWDIFIVVNSLRTCGTSRGGIKAGLSILPFSHHGSSSCGESLR